ncbi:barstar family protein [Actinoalloteichus hymeniacidonis]|uniref:Barstar (Barnase inhibitor) n=1 Tax=Actinoalloteichus hymeniacidonis TaxID=340345 RepID=A0AAC9HTZ7_9PSEU|nr:barstar family protein [Actinoalloteichus hymeniacidonis]AOS65081.1 Barstar (barnase inhibitor) [Actinoalloteichus hymeniacidonis]MBB5906840.1 RNAse (barnase) inhibitor barstar [Actinoalloteichus hymeniacidonis]
MSWAPVVEAIDEAHRVGAWPHVLDGRDFADAETTIAAIARLLAFPDTFGGNLDALYDYLRDLSWLDAGEHRLIWVHLAGLAEDDPTRFPGIRRAVLDAVDQGEQDERSLSAVFIEV